ncbi:hypothetical protein KI387_035631 [Taxus chinensis]|uniref:AAA+ ATPase domain-containing protein n=1 Tax=Taxus chinensis TaxID=29808 RepID=A0AA38FNW6_TAXCH|nr:hypothetical protein KI387_035631 [Taxus chinensis]
MGNTCCSVFCSSENEIAIDLKTVTEMVEDVNNLDRLISIIQQRLEAIANNFDKCQQNTAAQETGSSSWFASYTNFGKNLVEEVLKRAERNRCTACFKSSFNRETRKVVIDVLKEASQIHSLAAGLLFCASVDAGDLQTLESQIKHTYQDLTLGAVIGVLDNMPQFHPPTQGEDPSAVGIEEAKYRVIRLLKMDPMDESKRAVVLYGVGGVGKTTLASSVFKSLDLKGYNFCRLDMDQICSSDHIKQLQQQILGDLFGKRISLRSSVDGQNELAKAFREASDEAIFMFIDNALAQSDLTKLLPQDLSCLPRRMRMLLTTRRVDQTNILLRSTDFQRCEYRVDSLSSFDSKKLLCKIVLGSADASFPEGIESRDVDEIVEICGGIPLIIELVGPKLKTCIFNDGSAVKALKESLQQTFVEGKEFEMSERIVDSVFNSLNELCKEAFLDVVCFFIKSYGDIVSFVVGKAELEALEDAALVKLASYVDILELPNELVKRFQIVNVHDIISARGRKLSQMQSDRILDLESLKDAVQDKKKLKKIKGISIPNSEGDDDYEIEAEKLDLMHASLRHLDLPKSIKVNGTCVRSFESLKCFRMMEGVLPIDLKKLKRLAVLRGTVAGNVTELPSSLRCVFLYNSPNLPTLLPTFGNLSLLEMLYLQGCDVLVTLPTSIAQLKYLTFLHLSTCSNLTTLPETFGNLSALQFLYLSKCSKLATLPPTFGQLKSLVWLNMDGCEAITTLPNSFGNLSALIILNLNSCSNLSSLPESFSQLSCLKYLRMGGCERLTNLPNNFGELKSLKFLLIEDCSNLKTLNGDFGSLASLMALKASNCESLDGEAVDILVKMKSLMLVKIYGSERMIERWKEIGQHYPLIVIGDDETHGFLHTVEHTLFHGQSRFVGIDGDRQFMMDRSFFPRELGEEKEVEVAVLFTMCNLSLDSNIRALQAVREELEKRMKKTHRSGNFHIVYAGAGEKSEEHIRQMLLLLPRCSCACIPADDKTRQLFNFAVYKLFERGSSDAILSSHTCIVGLRVGLQRDNRKVKFQTDCFPRDDKDETRRKDDLRAMIDQRGGLKGEFTLLEYLFDS